MSRPIRVVLLTTSIEFGGIERFLLNLVRHMGGGVEFSVVVFTRSDTKDKTFFDHLQALGVRYEAIYVDAFKPKYLNALRNVAEVGAVLRSREFDLIHSHGYRADVIGLILSKLLGLPLVSTCHGFIFNDRRLRMYIGLNVFLLRYCATVIAVSATMKQDLVTKGVRASKIRVVTNAVCSVTGGSNRVSRREVRSREGFEDSDFVFGYVGRLSEEKGLDHLMRAACSLSAEKRTARLLIVGDGPRRETLEQFVRDHRLDDRVAFVGFQSDTSDWYSAMDAFVLPSLTEGTPMALLEAMAHGLPVIATSVGGVPAVLTNGEDGLLVPPADADRLSMAMKQILADCTLRETLSSGALRTVRDRYNVEAWTGKVREVYVATMQRRRELE